MPPLGAGWLLLPRGTVRWVSVWHGEVGWAGGQVWRVETEGEDGAAAYAEVRVLGPVEFVHDLEARNRCGRRTGRAFVRTAAAILARP